MTIEIDELKEKNICHACVGDDFLQAKISKEGSFKECSFCEDNAKCFNLDEFSKLIDQAFQSFYYRTSDEPDAYQSMMMRDREFNYDWERDGEPVIWAVANSCGIAEDIAEDVCSILEDEYSDYDSTLSGVETEFSPESYYEEKMPDDSQWNSQWSKFSESLQREARFFSRSGVDLLESIFGDIDQLRTSDNRQLIVAAGPDTNLPYLYRARVFQSDQFLAEALAQPDKFLGPPPSVLAKAGRMNAHGISVFYGANNEAAALAEVRPPVGSKVAIARFELTRSLQLLDLTALGKVIETGSKFDASFARRLERVMFLRKLSDRIAIPIVPDDEALGYLTTQAIADFLATESMLPIDGIIYPSIQMSASSLNVVLFHKASKVEKLQLPPNATVSASLGHWEEDGWEVDYTVLEEIPRDNRNSSADCEFPWLENYTEISSDRPSSLRVDPSHIYVHHVESVSYKSNAHSVRRHQFNKVNVHS